MKLTYSILLLTCSISFSCLAQSPVFVLEPTPAVLTNGSTVTIRWQPPVGVESVRLTLESDQYHGDFITQSAPNTGEYVWTVNHQNYDPTHYSHFTIGIDGCTTNFWCGRASGEYFTIVPAASRIEKIDYLGTDNTNQYFGIAATADAAYLHYLNISDDLIHWYKLENSGTRVSSNGLLLWTISSSYTNLFFRVETPLAMRP